MSWHYGNLLTEKIMQALVDVMLQESDYLVLPFGYKQLHPILCQQWDIGVNNTASSTRLINSPDILVFNKKNRATKIVKIKSHIHELPKYWVTNKSIQKFNEFWNDCILIEIIPKGEVFYAEYIAILAKQNEPEDKNEVRIRENFRPLNELFELDSLLFKKYKDKALSIIDTLRKILLS